MDYNDIIVIMLLAIIATGLGLILLKKDFSYLAQGQSTYNFQNSPIPNRQNTMTEPYVDLSYDNSRDYQGTSGLFNSSYDRIKKKNILNIRKKMPSMNEKVPTMNEKLLNIKNNKHKKYLTLENKKQIVNNTINKDSQSLESGSLMSFGNLSDANSIMGEINNINQTNNRHTLKNKIYSGKSQYKNSENQNRKVIIDDYSEFDDIKSLGNMDNTLSDLLSIVEKDK
jgi:hypothetical protein